MDFYMAPLEGITNYVYRNAHAKCFGRLDKYYTPFASPATERNFTDREMQEFLPEHNAGLEVVPQLMVSRADVCVSAVHELFDLGYQEVNLNFGCPSGLVSRKKKGSGMLRDPEYMDQFLDELFSKVDLARGGSRRGISIKSRIGFYQPDEFDAIWEIYKKYPLSELVLHPRVREEFYKGEVHLGHFEMAYQDVACQDVACQDVACHDVACQDVDCQDVACQNKAYKDVAYQIGTDQDRSFFPLIYNGDVFSIEDYINIKKRFPEIKGLMLGRGILRRPWIVEELRECEDVISRQYDKKGPCMNRHEIHLPYEVKELRERGTKDFDKASNCISPQYIEKVAEFLALLKEGSLETMPSPKVAHEMMKRLWSYMKDGLSEQVSADRLKAVFLSGDFAEYDKALEEIFDELYKKVN